jgi:hypothetical protein
MVGEGNGGEEEGVLYLEASRRRGAWEVDGSGSGVGSLTAVGRDLSNASTREYLFSEEIVRE